MIFFVSTHFEHKIVCWFVGHYTTVSATSRMDHYANTFRVRSGASQERANKKDGIGRILRGQLADDCWRQSQMSFLFQVKPWVTLPARLDWHAFYWYCPIFGVLGAMKNDAILQQLGPRHVILPDWTNPSSVSPLAHKTALCIFSKKNRSLL